jgi:hypothetical protein
MNVWRKGKAAVHTVHGRFGHLARPERFELPTPWFVAKYSIQMSYGRVSRIIAESWA